jgi:hypothetical protein
VNAFGFITFVAMRGKVTVSNCIGIRSLYERSDLCYGIAHY